MSSRKPNPKSYWNYRLIKMDKSCPEEPWYQVHEVWYENDVPNAYSESAITLGGDSLDEIMDQMMLISRGINEKSVLLESVLSAYEPPLQED